MLKKLVLLSLIVCCFGCDKKKQDGVGCVPSQVCTMEFAMIGVHFKDKNGNGVELKSLTVVIQRTKEALSANQIDWSPVPGKAMKDGYYIIADDNDRPKLKTDGEDVLVTATHPNGQVKTATYKISGGCNCHVSRISGPQVITFD